MTYIDNEFDGIPRMPYGGFSPSPVGTGYPSGPPVGHPTGYPTGYPTGHPTGPPSQTPGGGHGGMPTSPPPAQAVSLAKHLKNNPQLAKLILQHRPQSFSQLMQIVQSGFGGSHGQGSSSGRIYDESEFRQGPCWGDTFIIDSWGNPYIIHINTNIFGSYYGWCWELYSGFWYKCSIPHSSIGSLVCII
ncbi:hypothetical protein AAHB59_00125 [Bacillus cereus]